MMNATSLPEILRPDVAFPSLAARGIPAPPVATSDQEVPRSPAAPAAPPVQGMPPEAREAIAEAVREARRASAEAREQARQARQAQDDVHVDMGKDVIMVGTGGAGVGGRAGPTVVQPGFPHGPFDTIPPQVFDLALAFFFMIAFIVVGTAVARAFGRRADRMPAQAAASPELAAQLQRIEHAVEAMAIEVERISEAQRYMARLESERVADPALLARPGRRESGGNRPVPPAAIASPR